MKLLAITFGCVFLTLILAVTLFTYFTPTLINSPVLDASVIKTTAPLPPAVTVSSHAVVPTISREETKRSIAFTLPLTYTIGENHIYEDGLAVSLQTISDTRCITKEACTATAKLTAEFTFTYGTATETIILSAVSPTGSIASAYKYTLVNTSPTDATIIITQTNTNTQKTTTTTQQTNLATTPRALKTVDTAIKDTVPTPATPNKQTSTTSLSSDISTTEFKKALIAEIEKQTNEFRINNKRAPLSSDITLAKNATHYSTYLLNHNILSHTDLQGCDISCRFADKAYKAQAWGENLAMLSFEEQPGVEYVAHFFMTQWEKSAGHRENLLSKSFTNQGIGVSFSHNKIYTVVQFAKPQ